MLSLIAGLISMGGTSRAPKEPNAPCLEADLELPSVWQLINQTYFVFNATNPDQTSECWLCYSAKPPFYEAIGLQANFFQTKDPNQCRWSQSLKYKLTPQDVHGQGTCLGRVPPDLSSLCKQTFSSPVDLNTLSPIDQADLYALPNANAWWACNTGLTPCISFSI